MKIRLIYLEQWILLPNMKEGIMLKHLENDNFNEEISGRKILVDFYADWCGPCKMIAPILEELTNIDVLKVNVDEHNDVARTYGIMSIPTMVILDNGKELTRIVGYHTLDELNEITNQYK